MIGSNVLKNIRFLTMSSEEFARVVSQTSIGTASSGELDGGSEVNIDGNPSFLTKNEQIAIFMNLAIPAIVPISKGLSQETTPRCAPRKSKCYLNVRTSNTSNLSSTFNSGVFHRASL